jgi:hypothetical protein
MLGFVLSGIPVYYLTQSSDFDGRSRIICKWQHPGWFSRNNLFTLSARIKGLIDRLRDRSRASEGWEAVAAEETVELNPTR